MVNKQQIKAARAWLGMSQQQLADAAKVAKRTIVEFERGKSMPYDRTKRDIVQTLEARGIEFLFEGSVGVGIRTRG
jgi:DNA-binding XRE family transcriptional regulator